MENKKFTIKHDRDICIGCSACHNVCDKYWGMSDKDGKSNLLKGNSNSEVKKNEEGFEVLGSCENPVEKDFDLNLEAAESCPVNCIHVYEVDEDKKENKLI